MAHAETIVNAVQWVVYVSQDYKIPRGDNKLHRHAGAGKGNAFRVSINSGLALPSSHVFKVIGIKGEIHSHVEALPMLSVCLPPQYTYARHAYGNKRHIRKTLEMSQELWPQAVRSAFFSLATIRH
eukprot:scaffold86206_cov23-Prasinocladus_malaysianus.AAC.1